MIDVEAKNSKFATTKFTRKSAESSSWSNDTTAWMIAPF